MADRIMAVADLILEKAKKLEADGDPYGAILEYEKIFTWFRKTGYDKLAQKSISRLKKDAKVRRELTAMALLARAREMIRRDPSGRNVKPLLDLIGKKFPGTRATREADVLGKSLYKDAKKN